jgi:hypothetical protein
MRRRRADGERLLPHELAHGVQRSRGHECTAGVVGRAIRRAYQTRVAMDEEDDEML